MILIVTVTNLFCTLSIPQLVGLFTTDKTGDKADFQDHTRKYLSKGYDTLRVNEVLLFLFWLFTL